MLSRLKSALIGTPLPTQQLGEKRLNKIRALAAFSPDALSSIAYANQEIYLGLLVAGSAGLGLAWPIGLAIIGILAIVAISYYQTVHGYPSGGGSYIVARANLGILPGLVAAGALVVGLPAVCCSQPDSRRGCHRLSFPILISLPNWDCLGIARADHAGKPTGLARDRHPDGRTSLSVFIHLHPHARVWGYPLVP